MLKHVKQYNSYDMGTEYSVLRYKTLARTGGFAGCIDENGITWSKCGKRYKILNRMSCRNSLPSI